MFQVEWFEVKDAPDPPWGRPRCQGDIWYRVLLLPLLRSGVAWKVFSFLCFPFFLRVRPSYHFFIFCYFPFCLEGGRANGVSYGTL